mgnify:FL=1
MNKTLELEHTYLELPSDLYSFLDESTYKHAELVRLNRELASELNVSPEYLTSDDGVRFLTGQTAHAPLFAQAYAGHQYGYFTMLGDGRAMVLGERVVGDRRYDLQLKGSGKTPYSRRGDGKATMESVLREYLISAAMHHLGVPTTRSLAVLKTGERVLREDIHDGAILVRVAQSHIRIGTFEYARGRGDLDLLRQLADYTIQRHVPTLMEDNDKYLALFREVVRRQAELIAKWQSLGFVHGVMNTDNMLLSGETIDYGPCAFLDAYAPKTSFSSIDRNGRYAYFRQPFIASWNLSRLAGALVPLIHESETMAVQLLNKELELFATYYQTAYDRRMAYKIGIVEPSVTSRQLIEDLLELMEATNADFTNTFRHFTNGTTSALAFADSQAGRTWIKTWQHHLTTQSGHYDPTQLMRQHNPAIIPRNQLVDAVVNEAAKGDMKRFDALYDLLKTPYDHDRIYDMQYLEPLRPGESFVTYCGT